MFDIVYKIWIIVDFVDNYGFVFFDGVWFGKEGSDF